MKLLQIRKSFTLLTGFLLSMTAMGQQLLPYQNPNLSPEQRAKDLISRLTLEEKALLMQDQSPAISRLGIKKFNWWSEALHGLANNDSVTVFPEPIGMAASFDDALVYKIFNAVSDETRAKYNQAQKRGLENRRFLSLSVWTPNINIFRDPRWGRGQETYGEDPYLTSRMGISVVKGLQGPTDAKYRKLLACAKHFAVHSGPEWSRHVLNVNDVSPRDLNETYLPAFKALVTKADVREVMCAYQRLDDQPCCGNNRLLQTILRDEWGFKYLVVSDCGAVSDFYTSHKTSSDAVHAGAVAVSAGTDVECAGPVYRQLPESVRRGLISEDKINQSLMRIFEGRISLGEMDDDARVPWTKIPESVINNKDHKELALQMAREIMTLLTNKNDALPLSKSVKKIAVIGPNADDSRLLWGNYNGRPINTVTILEGIKTKVPAKNIVYDRACDLTDNTYIETVIGQSSIDGKQGIKATYWNNREMQGQPVTVEQITNPIQLTTDGQHEFATGVHLQDFSGKYETVYKPTESGEIVFKAEARGRFELVVNGDTLYKPVRFGSRSIRVPLQVEKGKEYRIEASFRQLGNFPASLSLNFGKEMPVRFDALINELKGIDVVVFAGGISSQLEGEQMPINIPGFKGGDRTDIQLPEVQRKCLQALTAAGKKVIFVDCSGSAIGLVPETQSCDAILQAWYGGEAGGQAVADVLFGDYNPSGKLPVTFYKDTTQLPDFEDYRMKGRTYRYLTSVPLFPFGYGLSYTSFSLGNAQTNTTEVKQNEGLQLTIPVSNIGRRDGNEVVQVYVRKVNDTSGLNRTLRGFQRIEVPKGKTVNAVINLPYSAFEFYDDNALQLKVTPGEYEIFYGNSSDAKDLKTMKVNVL
jgi:beta-glucosidase